MARSTHRAPLVVSEEEGAMLEELLRSRTARQRETEQARILLAHLEGTASAH